MSFPSDSITKCSFPAVCGVGARAAARRREGPQGCGQPWDERCLPLLPARHSNLACSPHHSGADWEHSIIFWPHK